jgi:hypothetical protein
MRQGLLSSLTIALLVALCGTGRTQEDARAIIKKAIKAQGGDTEAQPPRAVLTKIKGILHEVDGAAFTGEIISQLPNQQKYALHTEIGGVPVAIVQVFDGQKGWFCVNGTKEPANEAYLIDMKSSAYVNHVADLAALLTGAEFSLSLLPETKVQGKDAVGVLVSSKGRPDVKLFFDKVSGLLTKTEYRGSDPPTKKEVLKEEYLSDYREVRSSAADEQTVKEAKVADDDAALLGFLRKRALSDAERQRIEAQIRKLGDNSFQVREKAKDDLVAAGARAAPVLLQALKDPDTEVVSRARECLDLIGKNPESAVTAAVIRLLADRQPAGSAEVLLAYLPWAPEESVLHEVRAALARVAYRDGTPDKTLVTALEDKNPVRRTAAAAALRRASSRDDEPAGQRLTPKGWRRPFKGINYQDGKKYLEWELTEVQLFNKLDDSLFAKP